MLNYVGAKKEVTSIINFTYGEKSNMNLFGKIVLSPWALLAITVIGLLELFCFKSD